MLRSWWRFFSHRESFEREIDSEIAAHIEHKREALIQTGLSASEAERQPLILPVGARKEHCVFCRPSEAVSNSPLNPSHRLSP